MLADPRCLAEHIPARLDGYRLRQRLLDDRVGQARWVALAREHANQPSRRDVGGKSCQPTGAATHQLPRGLSLGVRIEAGNGGGHRLLSHPPLGELLAERPTGQPAAPMPGGHPRLGECLVVDQPDVGEPFQDDFGSLIRHSLAMQRRGQLSPRSGRAVEQSKADQPRHGFGVAGGILGIATVPRSGGPQKSTFTGLGPGLDGSLSESSFGPMPSFSLSFFSISSARSGLSRRNARTFSLPWPS